MLCSYSVIDSKESCPRNAALSFWYDVSMKKLKTTFHSNRYKCLSFTSLGQLLINIKGDPSLNGSKRTKSANITSRTAQCT